MRHKLLVPVLKYVFLWGYAAISLGLFAWVLIGSFKSNSEIFADPFGMPGSLAIDNYLRAWGSANIGQYFGNSLIATIASVFITMLLGSMVAYVISRFSFRGNALMWAVFALGMVIPMQSLLLPTFLKMNDIGLRDHIVALIVVYAVFDLPKTVFLLAGFMKGIPKEMEEAAIMDGSSYWRNYYNIILPLSIPGLATMCILSFIGSWNEYIYASVLIASDKWRTIPVGLANFSGEYSSEYGLICAGIVMTIIPVMIVYMLFQNQIVKGMSAGAVKG